MRSERFRNVSISIAVGLTALAMGFVGTARPDQATTSDGPPPDLLPPQFQHAIGDPTSGQAVFRLETFGNQGFWTDALQLPQGIAAVKLTPLQALQVGLSVNVDALNAATKQALAAALQQVQGGANPSSTALGDPNVTLSIINQNALIGLVTFDPQGNPKPQGNTGTLNLAAGDKVGLTCALCHAITDNSVLAPTPSLKVAGSVGKEVDGPTNHGLDVGAIIATAQRSLAYYPLLQLQLKVFGNATIGRGSFPGLLTTPTTIPTEAQADAYLTGTNPDGSRYYPVGQFDALPDGIGNPTHIMPLFRTDLASPWGNDGGIDKLDDFNNEVFTVSLDPTGLLTPGGREFLHIVAGPAGDEIANDYEQVLRGIGVIPAGASTLSVVPFVKAQDYLPAAVDSSIIGRRVDNKELLDLNAYLNSLQAPAPGPFDTTMAARGRDVFRTTVSAGGAGCTACHQLDPNKFVPPLVIPMGAIYPGYSPKVIFTRPAPQSPIQDSGGPSPYFDDRTVIIDASRNGGVRGSALPLKLDMARRTAMLHDDEIRGATFDEAADTLMNPAKRDPKAAHPFFVANAADRQAVIEFLKSLTTTAPSFTAAGVANAASFISGAVAPGELIVISGDALGVGLAGASNANTKVTFDGIVAPIISVTTTQIVVIAPYELAGKSATQLQVAYNGQSSVMVTLNVAPTAPGIFTLSGSGSGQAAVLNQDGSVNSPSNPAAKGSVISIFGTGEGQTIPTGVDGTIDSNPAPRPAAPTAVTIGGQSAAVTYAGGSPGLIAGVLQVNAIVPATANSGAIAIQLTISGASSQQGVTIWVQ